MWPQTQSSSRNANSVIDQNHKIYAETDIITNKLSDGRLDNASTVSGNKLICDSDVPATCASSERVPQVCLLSGEGSLKFPVLFMFVKISNPILYKLLI